MLQTLDDVVDSPEHRGYDWKQGMEFVMTRTDWLRKKGTKKDDAPPELSEDAMTSVMELVTMRIENVERIVHGMRWPADL